MAFDAYFLSGVLEELRTQALGARVEKIHQPTRDTIILLLRCSAGRQRLLIAANPTAVSPTLVLKDAVQEVKRVVHTKLTTFGTIGKAGLYAGQTHRVEAVRPTETND